MKHTKNHRLYFHMSEPVKFLGMTIFELVLGFAGFGGFMIHTGSMFVRTLWLAIGWGGIIFLRQLKKHKLGNNLKGFLTAQGILPAPSSKWPTYFKKVWVA